MFQVKAALAFLGIYWAIASAAVCVAQIPSTGSHQAQISGQAPMPCDETCQQGRANLRIQSRLAWFTGGLVVVGLLQVVLIGWQAIVLRQTKADVHRQADWMETQAGHLSRQADLINTQAEHMKEQTIVLRESVEAAQKSASAAIAQTQAMVDKERARVFVSPPTESVFQGSLCSTEFTGGHQFNFFNVGPTSATNVSARYEAVANEFEGGPHGRPSRIAPVAEVIAGNTPIAASLDLSSIVPLRASGEVPQAFYIHVFGEIQYNDVLSEERRSTRFQFRARMVPFRGDGTVAAPGGWQKSGNPEDNSAT
jgi:hypothetical protein